MSEGKKQKPVMTFHLPITVNYQEGTRFSGDNVGQKWNIQAANIGQVVVPSSVAGPGDPSPSVQSDSIPTPVKQEADEPRVQGTGSEKAMKIERMSSKEDDDFIAHARIRQLMKEGNFAEALIAARDIRRSREQQFIESECYCQIGNCKRALECIETLQTMMTSSPVPKVDDVIKLIGSYIADSSYIRALILLSCCVKLYKSNSDPNDAVEGIAECSCKCDDVIQALVNEGGKMKTIATDIGLKIITDMLDAIRSISCTDNKAEHEAKCLNNVGLSYKAIGKYQEAIQFYEQGIGVMEATFNSSYAEYKVSSYLLNNIGFAHENLGNYYEAGSFYTKSLTAKEMAEDWQSDEAKEESIEITKHNLKIIREKVL